MVKTMSFQLLLEYCINIGFECENINEVGIDDLEEFLNIHDLIIIKDETDPNKYYVDLNY